MDDAKIWAVIVCLGVGTFLLRFSFLGLLGDRKMPRWALRLLRYVPVSVLPALVAPAVIWPAATGGETEPVRLLAAIAALVVGAATRQALGAIFAGLGVLLIGLQIT
ncbi:AzlD domain-containing protein [Paracoccaceae bacterium GXU_MW_L88]